MMIFLTLLMAFADDVSAESSRENGENIEVQESDVQKTSVATPKKIETSTQPVTNIVDSIVTPPEVSKKRFSLFKRGKKLPISSSLPSSSTDLPVTPREYAVYTDYKVEDVPFEDRGWSVEPTKDRDVTANVTKVQRNTLFVTAGASLALYAVSSVFTSGVEEEYNKKILELESTTATPVKELEAKLNLYKLVGNVFVVCALGNISGGIYKHLQIGKKEATTPTKTAE